MHTLFRNMAAGVRKRWLDWCESHDWGQGDIPARFDGDEIVVHGAEHTDLGWQVVSARFTNPRDLRAWAGY